MTGLLRTVPVIPTFGTCRRDTRHVRAENPTQMNNSDSEDDSTRSSQPIGWDGWHDQRNQGKDGPDGQWPGNPEGAVEGDREGALGKPWRFQGGPEAGPGWPESAASGLLTPPS